MLTSKQRATLRALANPLETVLQIGKSGVTDTVIKQAYDALNARELIKLKTLESCPMSAREAAEALCERLGAEVVQVIGTKAVLFRQNSKDSKFTLE